MKMRSFGKLEPREIESLAMILTALIISAGTLIFTTGCGPDGVQAEEVGPTCACVRGDLIITELMINPTGDDDGLEYVEIMNVSGRDIFLDGLVLISGTDNRPDVSAVSGWVSPSIGPGARIVMSEAPPSSRPGGVSVGSMLLSNAAGTVSLMCGAVEIDVVAWGDSPATPPEGHALQMAPAASADAPRIWCASEDPADENGMSGSPGAPNHDCASGATCVDDANGTRRPLVRPIKDDLAITEVFANPGGSDTLAAEWIEIVAMAVFDIGGAAITHFNGPDETAASREFKIAGTACHHVEIGDVVVVGGPDGLPLEGASTFYNATGGAATIRISDSSGNVVATARHPKVPDGASVSLKTALATGSGAAAADDDPASWVTTRCGSGVAATPGTLDVVCRRK